MKSLVIGASGQVGKCLMRLLGADTVGTAHRRATGKLIPLNLADAGAVGRLIRDLKPRAIFVPGGVTAVDWCETHEAEARRICVDGSVEIKEAAQAIGAHAVYFSTDYVFSGDAGPYGREAVPDPLSAYGRVKLEAERAIGNDGLIIRTSMVYSDDPDSKNFHNYVRDTLMAGKEVKAFSDQTGSPTYAPDLARFAAQSAGLLHGLLHYAGPQVLTRVEFAVRVARAYGFKENLVRPVTSAELPLPAARPKDRGGLVVERESMPVDAALAEMSQNFRTRA